MSIAPAFDNDFQKKIMYQSFPTESVITSKADVLAWRAAWTAALKSWHSPYKAVVDCTHLKVADDAAVKDALAVMLKFFEGFFLRSVAGFGLDEAKGHRALPFTVFASEDEARTSIGIRDGRTASQHSDFRSMIQLQNHFQQHVVELAFAEEVTLSTEDQMRVLRDKLTNNLMQWHSKWSLLVDCTNLKFDPAQKAAFERMERYLKGFFMKVAIGYSPSAPKDAYPFEVFRARHNAVARLESEGNFSGDDADCKSKKVAP